MVLGNSGTNGNYNLSRLVLSHIRVEGSFLLVLILFVFIAHNTVQFSFGRFPIIWVVAIARYKVSCSLWLTSSAVSRFGPSSATGWMMKLVN